jgi:LPXTG-motif cell wall-anchored protein
MSNISRLENEIRTLRFVLAGLLITIIGGIYLPLSSPDTAEKIDLLWIYLLGVTLVAAIAAYVSFRRKEKLLDELYNNEQK